MSEGYDKFFKQARKASKAPSNEKFKINVDRELDPAYMMERALADRSASRNSGKTNGKRSQRKVMTPEERLRIELASKLRAKKNAAIRKRQSFPVGPAIVVVIALIGCGVGYYSPETYESLASHIEIGAFGKAQAKTEAPKDKSKESKEAPKAEKPAEKTAEAKAGEGEKAAETQTASNEEAVPNIRNWTPEELSFFNKLNERKKELDLREAELNKLEEELHRQKAGLDEKIKQLETMRSQISTTLKTRVATDQEKVDKLVQFYSGMKPQQAAKVIETINEDLAVEVLDKMKKKNASEIMNMMDAKKARRLSELLTGYQRVPAAADAGSANDTAHEDAGSEE